MTTKKSYDYQSAFGIIGSVMMEPPNPYTARAVEIGNVTFNILGGIKPETLTIHYHESFTKTHQGHGTDLVIVGGTMDYSTFDSRIKDSLAIVNDLGTHVDIIEEDGESIGEHLNCVYLIAEANGHHIEVIGNSTDGDTIKLRRVSVEGIDVNFNHDLPILVMDGSKNKSEVDHFLNDVNELGVSIDEELVDTDDDNSLVVLPLTKAIKESTLNQIKEKYNHLDIPYIK